jgi:hypothetical protein
MVEADTARGRETGDSSRGRGRRRHARGRGEKEAVAPEADPVAVVLALVVGPRGEAWRRTPRAGGRPVTAAACLNLTADAACGRETAAAREGEARRKRELRLCDCEMRRGGVEEASGATETPSAAAGRGYAGGVTG